MSPHKHAVTHPALALFCLSSLSSLSSATKETGISPSAELLAVGVETECFWSSSLVIISRIVLLNALPRPKRCSLWTTVALRGLLCWASRRCAVMASSLDSPVSQGCWRASLALGRFLGSLY